MSSATVLYLALYIGTLALHLTLAGATLIGVSVALVFRRDKKFSEALRSWLPFLLGLAITAGVAPLLFLQILYPHAVYTADLLLWKRFAVFLPALATGFYSLYVGKAHSASQRLQSTALSAAALCFLFVASTWSEQHLLSMQPQSWSGAYVDGPGLASPESLPRLVVFLGASMQALACIGSFLPSLAGRHKRWAFLGAGGAAVALLGIGWCSTDPVYERAQDTWIVAVAGWIASGVAWAMVLRSRPGIGRLASIAAVAALAIGSVGTLLAREWVRLAAFPPEELAAAHAASANIAGKEVFGLFLLVNASLITWFCVRVARS